MSEFRGNLTLTLVTMFFIVSTLFGLMHYWNEASGIQDINNGLDTKDASQIVTDSDSTGFSLITSIFSAGFFDFIANALSWLSPFAIVKAIIFIFTTDSPEIYTFVDLFILRPVGWIVFFIQFEWVAYYIRGKGF